MLRFDPLDGVRSRLGEAPVWCADLGELWHVDVHQGLFRRTTFATGETIDHWVAERVTFVLPCADGSAVVSVADGLARLPALGEAASPQLLIEPHLPGTSINDGKCDPRGRLWFGTLDRPQREAHCALYRLENPQQALVEVPDVVLANGLDWSPSGDRLYFVDSKRQRIDVFVYDLDSGTLGARREFARIDQAAGMPDGLTVDLNGNVWVALYGGGAVYRYNPDGVLQEKIPVPVRYPTSVAFAGHDLSYLAVTSAYAAIEDAGDQPAELDGAVLIAQTDHFGSRSTTPAVVAMPAGSSHKQQSPS